MYQFWNWILVDRSKQLIIKGIKPRVIYHITEPIYDTGQTLYATKELAQDAIYKVSRISDVADEYFKKEYGIHFWEINHREHKTYFMALPVNASILGL